MLCYVCPATLQFINSSAQVGIQVTLLHASRKSTMLYTTLLLLVGYLQLAALQDVYPRCKATDTCPLKSELKRRLTSKQFRVTQEKGTERSFTGELLDNKLKGTYKCVVCGNGVFSSDHKYDSKSGWPSFYDVLNKNAVSLLDDISHGMRRTEVTCTQCGAHLGHVFDDGPKPTLKRYCINSVALTFQKKQ